MTILKCRLDSIKWNGTSGLQIACQKTHDNIRKAAISLLEGKIVAFPTETVYGLGANAFNEKAVNSIFKAKGRPNDNPLIVHVSSFKMFEKYFSQPMPSSYDILTKHLWPGPLTILVNSPETLPGETTAHLTTVGVRMPSHPVARALIEISGTPLAAPSANSSGKPSPTTADHVFDDTFQRNEAREVMDFILDGGSSDIGLESTVIDGISEPGKIKILRPGGVTVEAIANIVGIENVIYERNTVVSDDFKPNTPGMKYKHYSPNAKVMLILPSTAHSKKERSDPTEIIKKLPPNQRIGCMTLSGSDLTKKLIKTDDDNLTSQKSSIRDDLEMIPYMLGSSRDTATIARNIFGGLHALDKIKVDYIIIEGVSEVNEGLAIMNRLYKAAGNIDNVFFI